MCLNNEGNRCAGCWIQANKCIGEPTSNCGKNNFMWCPDTKLSKTCCSHLNVSSSGTTKYILSEILGQYDKCHDKSRAFQHDKKGIFLQWDKYDYHEWRISTNGFKNKNCTEDCSGKLYAYCSGFHCRKSLCPEINKLIWLIQDEEHNYIRDKIFSITCILDKS